MPASFACHWPDLPLAFLHDCARCLALSQQGVLKLNPQGHLQPDSVARLADVWLSHPLSPDARSEAQTPALSFTVRLLQSAALLQRVSAQWLPSPTLSAWLNQPPALQLLHLRQAWWQHVAWDAAAIPAMSLPAWLQRRWSAVVETVCTGLSESTPDAWLPLHNIPVWLQQAGLLTVPDYVRNLPNVQRSLGAGVWGLAFFLIRTVLPCLGLIELTSNDGQLHLRPTAEGRTWLRIALERRAAAADAQHALEADIPYHELRFPDPAFPPLTVALAATSGENSDPAIEIGVTLAAPAACTFLLTHVAEPLPPAGPSAPAAPALWRYRITHASIARGVAWGYPVRHVLFLLARWTAGELDPLVVQQIWAWDAAQHTLTCESGYRLRGDPAVFAALRARKAFRTRARPLPGQGAVWVAATDAPALWTYLRQRGYTLLVLPAGDQGKTNSAALPLTPGSAGGALPLNALYIVARTYHHLRAGLPRLADVPLDALLRDLETALPSDERAALARLLASQEAILAQALEQTGLAASEPAPLPPLDLAGLAAIETILHTAIADAAAVELTYIDAHAQVTHRHVKPLRFEERAPHRYLVAHCTLRDEERHFRLDRIVTAEPLTE